MPVATSKIRADLSDDAVTSLAPPGITATALIGPAWPSKARAAAGVQAIALVPSPVPSATTTLPPAGIATPRSFLSPPANDSISRLAATSQSRTEPSPEVDAEPRPRRPRTRGAVAGPSWTRVRGAAVGLNRRVPEPGRLVGRARGEGLAVARDRNRLDRPGLTRQVAGRLPFLDAPEPDDPVGPPGDRAGRRRRRRTRSPRPCPSARSTPWQACRRPRHGRGSPRPRPRRPPGPRRRGARARRGASARRRACGGPCPISRRRARPTCRRRTRPGARRSRRVQAASGPRGALSPRPRPRRSSRHGRGSPPCRSTPRILLPLSARPARVSPPSRILGSG